MRFFIAILFVFSLLTPGIGQTQGTPDVQVVQGLYGSELELHHALTFTRPLLMSTKYMLALTTSLYALQFYNSGEVKTAAFTLGALAVAAIVDSMAQSTRKLDMAAMTFLMNRLANHIEKTCVGCRRENRPGRAYGVDDWHVVRFTYQDGWWFDLSIDMGCIEIRHQPSTQAMIENNKIRLQRDLYDRARELGLKPTKSVSNAGGTHINIGLQTFGSNGRLMRNFMVDFYNHPELVLGIWSNDPRNAPYFSKEDFEKFREAVAVFDGYPIEKQTPQNFIFELQAAGLDKFMSALSIRNAGEDTKEELRRLELRAMRAVLDANHLGFVVDLIERRLNYLARIDHPIALIDSPPKSMRAHQKIDSYKEFVRQSGANWDEARTYLSESLRFHVLIQGLLSKKPKIYQCSKLF